MRFLSVLGSMALQFLGHVVDQRGILPDLDKVSAVTDWPVPSKTAQSIPRPSRLLQTLHPRICKNCLPLECTNGGHPE